MTASLHVNRFAGIRSYWVVACSRFVRSRTNIVRSWGFWGAKDAKHRVPLVYVIGALGMVFYIRLMTFYVWDVM